MYITNKYQSVQLPNEPGMLAWLKNKYPNSGYYVVEAIRENIVEYTALDEQTRLAWVRNYMETV